MEPYAASSQSRINHAEQINGLRTVSQATFFEGSYLGVRITEHPKVPIPQLLLFLEIHVRSHLG